jgi:hypothetical protein
MILISKKETIQKIGFSEKKKIQTTVISPKVKRLIDIFLMTSTVL